VAHQFIKVLFADEQQLLHGFEQHPGLLGDPAFELLPALCSKMGRSRGRSRTRVRDKVGNRKVNLVPDAGDDRDP
jgi:hypothetical protein